MRFFAPKKNLERILGFLLLDVDPLRVYNKLLDFDQFRA